MVVSVGGGRSEIAFFDVETTVPGRPGQGYALLEFGAILVCPKTLVELESYSTLVRPADVSLISSRSIQCNGITRDDVASAPTFSEIADKVYDFLHGRIWAGHNILRFDCTRIREAFEEINRPPPEPKGTMDSLAVLTQRFGRRAGDMKMATLAAYFGLGQQTHRSLDDVRMNLEVVKYCATVLFLESNVLMESCWVSPNATTRSRSNGPASRDGMIMSSTDSSSPSIKIENHHMSSPTNQNREGTLSVTSLMTPKKGEEARPDPFNMGPLGVEVEIQALQSDSMDEESSSGSPESTVNAAAESEGSNGHAAFLEPNGVYIPSISVSLAPFYRGIQRIQVMHRDVLLQLSCTHLKVRFGVSTKFLDYAGRPRLSFVVDATPNLCRVLDACDGLAQRLSVDSGCSSEWRPVVTRKGGFMNSPTVRLQIPTVADGVVSRWLPDIYKKEGSATPQRLVFNRYDIAELDALFTPGTLVDACFSLDPYDYQQSAGIRLVAKKLIIHSN